MTAPKNFTIISLAWRRESAENHRRAGFTDVPEDSEIKASLTALVRFFAGHKLLTRDILEKGSSVGEDFELNSADVTETGMAVLREGLGKWQNKWSPSNNLKPLEKAYAKVIANSVAAQRSPKQAARPFQPYPFREKTGEPPKLTSGKTTVYDKAKYHYEGDFPEDLDQDNAFTHIGMFLGWLCDRQLLSDEMEKDYHDEIEKFWNRRLTGPGFLQIADGTLSNDMLIERAQAFAKVYFADEDGNYYDDYEELLVKDLPSFYHVQDTWENYEILKRRIDERYQAWLSKHPGV